MEAETPSIEVGDGTLFAERFAVQKLLGRGEMGSVWLAHDTAELRPVALKIVTDAIRRNGFASVHLKRALRQAMQLQHPNIASVFEFIETENGSAIVSEYVDGQTLAELRAHKRANCFAASEISAWVTSLCDALAYAHDSNGVVHRNLHPGNLLVSDELKKLKVTDFALGLENSTQQLAYMSPQQMRGEEPTLSDDVYAFGAILFELLSSKTPFAEGDLAAQIEDRVPPPVSRRREQEGIAGETIPKHWEETIAACLEKHPSRRPHDFAEVAERLRLGGTIRFSGGQEELKTRALAQNLTHARIVGAAAGVAALVAAAILVGRAMHPSRTETQRLAQAALPGGYATEAKEPGIFTGTTIVPESDPDFSPLPSAETTPASPEKSKTKSPKPRRHF